MSLGWLIFLSSCTIGWVVGWTLGGTWAQRRHPEWYEDGWPPDDERNPDWYDP